MTIILFLLACDPMITEVQMTGTVLDAPANAGNAVGDATVTALNGAGEPFGVATTDADGAFSVTVPAGAPFFVGVEKDGYVPTAFSGTSGVSDFDAGAGYPWLSTEDWATEERARWEACANYTAEGGFVSGQALAVVPGVDDFTSWPPLPDAELLAYVSGDLALDACYLDDEGVVLAAGESTGKTGEYAIFGVPAGQVVIELTVARSNGEAGTDLYQFVAFEDGLIPVFPTPVEL